MKKKDVYKIRPAGRHILTIGEDLIQDKYAAIVELVKNAYDADSPLVKITFTNKGSGKLQLTIEDKGHGMSYEDILNKWLVPSTNYKVNKRESPNGRTMQGRKGIGRYAASILGDDLLLETTDLKGEKTKVYVEWSQFENHAYLDDVEISVKREQTNESNGTKLIINETFKSDNGWTETQLDKLRFELKKLIPPKMVDTQDDHFNIELCFDDFPSGNTVSEVIEPYPILDLYDYRISGTICENGKVDLTYENQKIRNNSIEHISKQFDRTKCGNLVMDIRVYDRDPDDITRLINRGLRDEKGKSIQKNDAKILLNTVNGIGVYRNGFRIRPLGDADFDWLELNAQRVQNPSLKIGSNQVVGYVHIESEEKSRLEEKSARDGLKNDVAFERLIELTNKVIIELEQRRYIHRRRSDLSKPRKKIEQKLEGLYDYSRLTNSVTSSLKGEGLSKEAITKVQEIITDEQNKKNRDIEEIKTAVAVYQGQATLGKILYVVLHEGRRPLNYFKNQIPNLEHYVGRYISNPSDRSLEDITKITSGISTNSDVLAELFKKLDPLSSRRRSKKRELSLYKELTDVVSIFELDFYEKEIEVIVECDKNITFYGWVQDIYTIFANLIDNSIYWIEESNNKVKQIRINVIECEEGIQIDYTDSGPGIEPDLIESEVIFEPEFTTKTKGTGLGLSIAGESAHRNGLRLKALQNEDGVHFRLSTNI